MTVNPHVVSCARGILLRAQRTGVLVLVHVKWYATGHNVHF